MRTGCTEPWNPNPCRTSVFVENGSPCVSWEQETPGARFFHKVWIRTSADTPEILWNAILRTCCHVLINTLPDEALLDACQSLLETRAYWRSLSHDVTPHTLVATTPAKLGPTYERPIFSLPEE